ncbi:MAG: hypothetical protein ACLPXB_02825 [Thiobacillaceae bacterium]
MDAHLLENPHRSSPWLASVSVDMLAAGMTPAPGGGGAGSRDDLEERPLAIITATPFFMGVAAIKFKGGDMVAMGKNLGGAVCLFLVPKIVEVIISWAQR